MLLRRRPVHALIALSALTATAFVVAGAAHASSPPAPWLQSGYNGAGSNVNTVERAITARNVRHLVFEHRILPRGKTGSCSSGIVNPLFSESRVYAINGTALVAYSAYTGKQLWRTPIGIGSDTYATGLAVSHGAVLVGSDSCYTSDPTGFLDLYNSSTGKHIKALYAPDTLENFVVSGRYVVAKYACPECGGYEQTVVYDLPSGAVVWKTRNPEQSDSETRSAAVVGGHVYVERHGALRALDVATGKQAWHKAGQYTVVSGDSDGLNARTLLVASDDHTIAALSPRTGATRFVLSHTPADPGETAVGSRRLFAPCGVREQALCAYRVSDGARLWRVSGQYGGVAVANGLVFLGDGRVLGVGAGKQITDLDGYPAIVGSGLVGEYESAPGLDGLAFDWFRT